MITSLIDASDQAHLVIPVTASGFAAWLETQSEASRTWLKAAGFTPSVGKSILLPREGGGLLAVLVIVDDQEPLWALAGLPDTLPEGDYRLAEGPALADTGALQQACLGWALGAYQFTKYKAAKRAFARLVWPDCVDRAEISALADAIHLARDLINTPAEAMGPAELAAAAADVAARHGASLTVIEGDALLPANYPLIHAVGRGSARAPRLIDLVWGPADAPKVTLVGKGVCFDSGGLDIKPSSSMKLMKKDMGGAATVLALAQCLMAMHTPIRLRVLIPAVENFVSSTAFRPMDIFKSRKGLTVEIGNTDAEGRLVLCDALAEACTENPAILIDMATLTGAARVALGPDLPVLLSQDEALANDLLAAGTKTQDPLWRLPLWQPYRKWLDSKIADLNSAPDGGMAGAITAALYLQAFVEPGIAWAHIDTFAWNSTTRAGRIEGGEALALRAVYRMIRTRFAA